MPQKTDFPWTEVALRKRLRSAVRAYWQGRSGQGEAQGNNGSKDRGTRSEVTGGQHLNQFLDLIVRTVRAADFSDQEIKLGSGLELPGYFRPKKMGRGRGASESRVRCHRTEISSRQLRKQFQ